MPLRWKKSEGSLGALQQLCRKQIGKARASLKRGGRPGSIHEVRKEIKKVRAALQLMRVSPGREARHQAMKVAKTLRKAASCLASSRDARVMLRAFEGLTKNGVKLFPELRHALRRHCRREVRNLRVDKALKHAIRLLRKAERKLAGLKVSEEGRLVIEPGLNRSLARAKEFFETAVREPSEENFHEWRKRVKNLWYQLRLPCPSCSGKTKAFLDKLERLGEQLGEKHDLSLLKRFIAKHEAVIERRELGRLIDDRQEVLRLSVLALGNEIFMSEIRQT